MAIAFDSDSLVVDSDGGTVTPSAPSGAAADKLVVAMCIVYDSGGVTALPSGWAQYRQDDFVTGHNWQTTIAYKVLTGGDSYAFTTTGGSYTIIYVACYTGAHATAPLVDTGSINSGVGTAVTGNGVTVTTADSFLFASMVGYFSGLSVGFGGMTERELNTGGESFGFFDEGPVGAGATGDRTATLAASNDWSVTMGVIAPAGTGGGGSEPVPIDHYVTSFGMGCMRKPKRDDGRWVRGEGGLWLPRAA